LVFAKQDGAVLYGQINELLVIGIFAGDAGFGGSFYDARPCIKHLQNFIDRKRIKGHALGNFWISQNTL